MSKIQFTLDGINAGLGAGFVSIASRCPGYSNCPDQRTACFDNHSATNNDRAGQIANTCLHHAGLTDGEQMLMLLRKVAAVHALPEAVAGV
jgi:hypothetical protein